MMEKDTQVSTMSSEEKGLSSNSCNLDLPVSPPRSQSNSQPSSSLNPFRQFPSTLAFLKQRPLVSKPSPPPFNQSGRGAKQLAKAMEMQQKQQQYSEYPSSVVSNSSPLVGRQPLNEELSFVMCYGSTPCFAKVVSNPSSCKNAASESIMINPFRVNPLNDRLLMSWSGVVWLAKRHSIRPVQMTMEPGGFRVVDSAEVREFIDLMVSKGRLTYPVDIEHRKDVDCDMVSLDSGSTDNNLNHQVDLTLYPKLPPSSGLLKTVKSSPSKGEAFQFKADEHTESAFKSSVAQITPSSSVSSNSGRDSGSGADRVRPSFYGQVSAPRPKPRLDLINSSYYQRTPLDALMSQSGRFSQNCSTPTESGSIVRLNSVSSSGGGGAKSVRFTEDLTSPCTTVESCGGVSSVVLDSPVTLVFEGIASNAQHTSSSNCSGSYPIPPFAVSPCESSLLTVPDVIVGSDTVVVESVFEPSAVEMCSISATIEETEAASQSLCGDIDVLAEVCKERAESVTSESDCCFVVSSNITSSSSSSTVVEVQAADRFMSPVTCLSETISGELVDSLRTPDSTTMSVDAVGGANSAAVARNSVSRKRGPSAAGLPPLAPLSAGKNRKNSKSSFGPCDSKTAGGSTVHQGILLESEQEQVSDESTTPAAAAAVVAEKPSTKVGAGGKTSVAKSVVAASTASLVAMTEPVGRTKRAASLNPVHRDAVFGTRPSSKQSAATGSWTIK